MWYFSGIVVGDATRTRTHLMSLYQDSDIADVIIDGLRRQSFHLEAMKHFLEQVPSGNNQTAYMKSQPNIPNTSALKAMT